MTRLTQCHRIADAACDSDIVGRRALGQIGQPGAMAGQRRLVIAEADFHLMIAGNCAHACGDGALEGLGINRAFRYRT